MNEQATASEVAASPGPVPEENRLDSLDLLRGFAILGILFVNMHFFAMPMMEAVAGVGLHDMAVRDQLAWGFVKVFCEFKFVSTFSILFGAGMIMQLMRSERSGSHGFARRYFRRILVLALFGAIHAFLLWYGDILLFYAVIGSLVFLLRNASARTLIRIAAGLIAFSVFVQMTCTGVQVLVESAESASAIASTGTEPDSLLTNSADDTSKSSTQPGAEFADEMRASGHPAIALLIESQGDPFSDAWTEGETIAYRDGPFIDAFVYRAISYLQIVVFSLFGFGWHVAAMFLIGAALMKLDFFSPSRRPLQGRIAMIGLASGLPIELLHGWLAFEVSGEVTASHIVLNGMHVVGAVALCLGYVGSAAWLSSALSLRWLHYPVRCVGRMALTTYIGSTAAATLLMYWWGLRWFGDVGMFDQVIIALCIYAGLAAFSAVWLTAFRFGPLEWVWRSLTYRRFQPILKGSSHARSER